MEAAVDYQLVTNVYSSLKNIGVVNIPLGNQNMYIDNWTKW